MQYVFEFYPILFELQDILLRLHVLPFNNEVRVYEAVVLYGGYIYSLMVLFIENENIFRCQCNLALHLGIKLFRLERKLFESRTALQREEGAGTEVVNRFITAEAGNPAFGLQHRNIKIVCLGLRLMDGIFRPLFITVSAYSPVEYDTGKKNNNSENNYR